MRTASAGLGAAALLLSGCATTIQDRTAVQRVPPPAATKGTPSQAAALAERAKRDVEQVKALGNKPPAAPAPAVPADAPADASAQAAAKPPAEIQWILPQQGQAEPPATSTEQPGGHVVSLAPEQAQAPLAHDKPAPAPDAERTRTLIVDLCSELYRQVGSSRVDLQACKLEYSIVSPK